MTNNENLFILKFIILFNRLKAIQRFEFNNRGFNGFNGSNGFTLGHIPLAFINGGLHPLFS
jgi:hypothetical protein